MMLFYDFRIACRIALRARFFSFSVSMALVMAAAAVLAAEFSGRQPATVALDVGLSVIRLTLPVVAVLFLQELLSREFDRKLYLTSLTYPRPRYHFLVARIAAITVMSLLLLITMAALLAGLTTWIGHGYKQVTPPSMGLPYVATILFIAVDLLIGIAIGSLIAVFAITPSFVLVGTIGFMLVARSFSAIATLLARDETLVTDAQTYQSTLNLLGYVLPDLAALDVRMVALYGNMQFLPPDWPLRVASALAYAAALCTLASWALNRKHFA